MVNESRKTADEATKASDEATKSADEDGASRNTGPPAWRLLEKSNDEQPPSAMKEQDSKGSVSPPTGEVRIYDARLVPEGRSALIEWVLNPPINGEEQMVQAFVERDKSGALGRFYPLFRVLYEEVLGRNPPIMYSRKLKGTRHPNFLISLDESDMGKARGDRGAGYIGKMQGSGNNQFTMFDHGANPTSNEGLSREARRNVCHCLCFQKGTTRRATGSPNGSCNSSILSRARMGRSTVSYGGRVIKRTACASGSENKE